jgi:hypothetical protein
MKKELLKIDIGVSADMSWVLSQNKYDSFVTTKSRLKRNGEAEFKQKIKNGVLLVTRLS